MKRLLPATQLRRLHYHLARGGLVAYPTESCYGLGCLPTHPIALRRLVRLKKRPQHKGMIVIGDSIERLQPLLQSLPLPTQHQLQHIWPARITFLLPTQHHVPALLRGKQRKKLAVRVPAHQMARNLCKALKHSLVSTSCNRAGRRPCRHEREVRRQFGRQVWIVGGQIGKAKSPSQIIDWSSGKRWR